MFYLLVFLTLFAFLTCSHTDDCSAIISIANELPNDVTVSINDENKIIPGWGECTEQDFDDNIVIVACDTEWDREWDSAFNLSCSNDENEDDCEKKTVEMTQ